MKSTALFVLVALFLSSDLNTASAITINQKEATLNLVDIEKAKKTKAKGKKASKKSDKKKKEAEEEKAKKEKEKEEQDALEEEKKAIDEADANAPADDTKTAINSFNGADEDEIIDNKMADVSKEALNPAGVSTGEKIVWKEDALKASKDIIKTLKGLKGPKLTQYMKEHFEDTWATYDVNGDGEISLEESHVF